MTDPVTDRNFMGHFVILAWLTSYWVRDIIVQFRHVEFMKFRWNLNMSPGLWYWHDLPHPCPSEVSRISDPRIWQLLQYCLAYCCSALQLHLDLIYCCSVYILLHCVTYCCSVLHLPLDPTVLPFRTTDSRAPTLSDCCWVWQGVAGCCRVLQGVAVV